MGRETKNFRQSAKSQSGNQGARDYGKIQRQGSWGGGQRIDNSVQRIVKKELYPKR